MIITREKTIGVVGTIIFGILLFLILLFSFIRTISLPEGLEGIPVMFGNVPDAFGNEEPPMALPNDFVENTPSAPPVPSTPKNTEAAPIITQNTEATIDVKAQEAKEKEKKQAEELRKQEQLAEQRRVAEETRVRQEQENSRRQINNQVGGLFGDNPGGSRGNTHGTGVQGVPTGNSTTGAASGVGGVGTYDLGGRSLGRGGLAQPKYTVDDYGTVVVNITVDSQGNVIHAEIGKGTNTPSATLRSEAIRAAKSTKFNTINSANNQQGTITYKFNLN